VAIDKSVCLMSLEVVSLLKAFQNDKWSESDVVVGGADPPVRWFASERRIVPISEHCLEYMAQSKCLVDYPGGGMVVYKVSPKGGVLQSTWSVLCICTRGGGPKNQQSRT
jgi:hypothetical protein